VALILNEPFPVRFAGVILVIDNHVSLLDTVHVLSEVTFTVVFAAAEAGFQVLADKDKLPDTGCCVTVNVRVGAPGAVTVIVPVLATAPGLAMALTLNEPFPVRFAGDILEIDNHVSLLETVHVRLEVTFTVVLPAADGAFQVLADKVRAPDTGA